MERFSTLILTGMSTLFFGGMIARSRSINAVLSELLILARTEPMHRAFEHDLANITRDARQAEKILINERKKG